MLAGRVRRNAHGHIVGDDGDFRLEVDAPGLVGDRDRRPRREEAVGAALIHQGVGPEAFRHLRAARLAHKFHVIDIGRAVRPLIGARQGRQGFRLIEG